MNDINENANALRARDLDGFSQKRTATLLSTRKLARGRCLHYLICNYQRVLFLLARCSSAVSGDSLVCIAFHRAHHLCIAFCFARRGNCHCACPLRGTWHDTNTEISPFPLSCFFDYRPAVSRTTSLSAEWVPKDGKWEEKDYETELKKLEKEAEERLDTMIAEMMSKIETTGAN